MGTVANLAVRISANAEEFEKGVAGVKDSATSTLGSLGKIGVALAGIFSVSEITQAIEKVGEWGGKIVDFSNRLGISAEAVQRFKFAAEQGGSSIQTIGRAIEFANRGLVSGDTGFVGALGRVGLTLDDIRGLSPDQMFIAMAAAIDQTTNAAIKDEAAQKLMGRAGQELQQILPDLIRNFNEAPVAMGGAAEAADMLGDAWDRLKTKGEAIAGNLAFIIGIASQGSVFSDLLGALDKATDTMVSGGGTQKDLGPRARKGALGITSENLKDIQLVTDATSTLDERLKHANETTREHAERMKAAAAAAREVDRAEAAFRQTLNMVGEGLMKADKASMDYFANMGRDLQFVMGKMGEGILMQATLEPQQFIPEPEIDRVADLIRETQERVKPVWDDLFKNLRQRASDAFTGIIFQTTSFKDGFISIWHSLKASLMDIVSDIINNVLKRLVTGFANVLTGAGSFGSAFGGLGSALGGMLGIGGHAAAGAGAGAAGAGAGAAAGGGGLGALFTNPWTAVIGGAAALTLGIVKGGLFRGGEEALKVNPARDAFFRDFQDRFGGDQQAALATAFAERGIAGDVADRMIKRLYEADTMKEFEAATAAINQTLAEGAKQNTTSNSQLGLASTQATEAVSGLTAAISGLSQAATAVAAAVPAMGDQGTWNDPGYAGPEIASEGAGIMASGGLVMDEAGNFHRVPQSDMTGGGISVILNGGTFIGNSQEFEDAVGTAFNNAVEGGGDHFTKFRKLTTQAVAAGA